MAMIFPSSLLLGGSAVRYRQPGAGDGAGVPAELGDDDIA
jgi:hypothetical protein